MTRHLCSQEPYAYMKKEKWQRKDEQNVEVLIGPVRDNNFTRKRNYKTLLLTVCQLAKNCCQLSTSYCQPTKYKLSVFVNCQQSDVNCQQTSVNCCFSLILNCFSRSVRSFNCQQTAASCHHCCHSKFLEFQQ